VSLKIHLHSPARRRRPHPHWDCWEYIQNEGKKTNKDNSKISLIWEFRLLTSATWKNTRNLCRNEVVVSHILPSRSQIIVKRRSRHVSHIMWSHSQSLSQRLAMSCGKTPAKCRRNSKISNNCRQCPWALLMFTAAVDILTRKCGNKPLQL